MSIRNAAKALIINDNKLLLNKCKNSTGYSLGDICNNEIYFDLPGGGQNKYETIMETVKRECLEETGYDMTVDKMVGIYEEIYMEDELRKLYPDYAHKMYFIFLCHLSNNSISSITERDWDQISSEWIDIGEISELKLWPNAVKINLHKLLKSEEVIFLGSEHIE